MGKGEKQTTEVKGIESDGRGERLKRFHKRLDAVEGPEDLGERLRREREERRKKRKIK